jgi:hypothetical protein
MENGKWIVGADKQKEKQKIEGIFNNLSHQLVTKLTKPSETLIQLVGTARFELATPSPPD